MTLRLVEDYYFPVGSIMFTFKRLWYFNISSRSFSFKEAFETNYYKNYNVLHLILAMRRKTKKYLSSFRTFQTDYPQTWL